MGAEKPSSGSPASFQASWRPLLVVLSLLLAMDPLAVSLVRQFPEFNAKYVEPPPRWATEVKDSENKLSAAEKRFEGDILGPESLAFDPQGRGPYTGLSDGRIVRWEGPERGWRTFAVTSPNRTERCMPKQRAIAYIRHEHVCGRPLGLRFNRTSSSELYVADAYMGLLVVGAEGGLARVLTNRVDDDGSRIRFANDVDFAKDGSIYFTDTSSKYQRRQYIVAVLEGDDSGRLLRYDPATGKTSVALSGLRFPNGIAVSQNGSFLLLAESITGRLLRYWLQGEKAGTKEVFATLPGNPDNVRLSPTGDFWVAMYSRSRRLEFLAARPRLKNFLLRIPVPLRYTFRFFSGPSHGMVARYSPEGELLELLEDASGKSVHHVSEVEERDGHLWFGSVISSHIAVYKRNVLK